MLWRLQCFYIMLIGSVSANYQVTVPPLPPVSILTDEDIRFASQRCQSDHAGSNVTLRQIWASNEFPNDHLTHCYVKCFLKKLGLIDLTTRGFNLRRLIEMWKNMNNMTIDEKCIQDFQFIVELDGTCRSIYNHWMEFRSKCFELVKYTFLESGITASDAYIFPIQSKPLTMSATEFCDAAYDNTPMEGSPLAYHKKLLGCIFRHFRYFDAYGRLDESEILRSFHETQEVVEESVQAVRKCTHRGNLKFMEGHCEMAFELENCLTEANLNFPNVYRYRDNKTRQY